MNERKTTMNNYTYDQLEQALGPSYKLVPYGGKGQARIQTSDGFDIAFIDFEDGRMEASLDAKWHAAESAAPESFPDSAAIAAARQEIAEELQQDWEIAGFTVPEEGAISWYWYPGDPSARIPLYRVDVRKDIPTLEEAVKTIQWARYAQTETWV